MPGLSGFKGVSRDVLNAAIGDMPGWKNLGNRILNQAKAECPVSDSNDNGPHLRDTLEVRFITGADPRILIGSWSKGDVLKYVVQGTSPHDIQPKMATALHWVSGGADFFARSVSSPGTKPNDFVTRSATEAARSV